MILRLLRGRLLAGDAVRVLRRLATDDGATDGLLERATGFRDEGDRWAVLAASVWTDMHALDAHAFGATGGFGPLPAGGGAGIPEHFELIGGSAAPAAVPAGAAIGLLTATVLRGREPEAIRMVEAQRARLLGDAVVRMHVGRRMDGDAMELAAVAVWRDRNAMRAFLGSRPAAPIDPEFVALTRDWRLETYDTFDADRDVPTGGSLAAIVVDGTGRLVDASEAVERVLGMPPELLIGRPLEDWVAPDERLEFRRRLSSVRAAGIYEGEVDFERPDGTRAHVRLQARGGVPEAGLAAALVAPAAEPLPTAGAFESAVRGALAATAGRPSPVRRPRLVPIPSTDLLFGRFIERVAGTLGSPSPRRLTLHLRALYPRLAIHRRELAAERGETWYVFRDGRLAPRLAHDWWLDPSLARALLDPEGTFHEANPAALELFEATEHDVVTLRSLAPPGVEDDLELLLSLTRTMATFDTVIGVRGLHGASRLLAIHGEVTTAGARAVAMPVATPPGLLQIAPICLPAWDDMFIERVERIAEGLAGQNVPLAAERLESRLRERYPSAVVRVGAAGDGFGPETAILLVYRDGDRSPYAVDRWWERDDTARLVSVGERHVDANEPALALLEVTRAELLATSLADFEAPEVADDARWLRDILLRTGQLHATTWLRRRDGSRIAVEIHAELRPDGATETWLRALSPSDDIA